MRRYCFRGGKCKGAEEISFVFFLVHSCLFRILQVKFQTRLLDWDCSTLLAGVSSLPSVMRPAFISTAGLVRFWYSSRQFHNIRETGSAWSFPVSLFSFPWVAPLRFSGSFRLTVKTSVGMTWLWYITQSQSQLCRGWGGNKRTPFTF